MLISLFFLEYAFYIDSKGNRLFNKFLIEWEGNPESFAFSYPFAIAFHSSYIEVRSVITVRQQLAHLKYLIYLTIVGCD